MSRHEGVSCDACLRNNFRGRRYKCLVCYDYDLCSNCYESGSISTRHTAEHPMQCILTRADFELFYGGEALPLDQSQSLTCPHCGKMGFTDLSLADHVTAQHADATTQVVCPVCASIPNGEPNHMTEDLTSHLTVDHRGGGGGSSGGSGGGGARDLISFGDEPTAVRHPTRRIPHPGRSVSGSRIRRFNMHFRESMDPITELLSQLSGVRRAASSVGSAAAAGAGGSAASSSAAAASQLQQLQMHLQLERQQYAQVARQASERPPRRQITFVPTLSASAPSSAAQASAPGPIGSLGPVGQQPAASAGSVATVAPTAAQDPTQLDGSRAHFLLSTISDDDSSALESVRRAVDRDDRARFAQELVLSTLTKSFEDSLSICDVTKQLLQPPAAVAAAASSRAPTGSQRSQKPSAVTSSGSSTTATSGSTAAVASSATRRPAASGAAASTTAAVAAASLTSTNQRQNIGGYHNSSQQPTAAGRTAAAAAGTSSTASGRSRGGGATSRGGRGGGGAAASLLRVLDPAAASRGRRKPVLTRPPPPGNGSSASGGGSTSSVPSLEAAAGAGGVRAAANGASDTR